MSIKVLKNHERNLTIGPIFKQIFTYSLPLLLTIVLQRLFHITDTLMLGAFAVDSDNAMAATGTSGSIINIITGLALGLSVGAQVSLSHAVGENDKEKARKVVGTAILISVMAGLIAVSICEPLAGTLLRWTDCPEAIMKKAVLYFRIYAAGLPFLMFNNFASGVLRATGDTFRPMVYSLIGGVLNVGLNAVFIIAIGWDVQGVALATVISQGVTSICLLIVITRGDGFSRFKLKYFKLHKEQFIKMVKIGLPSGIHTSISAVANTVVQTTVNSFGELAVAGNSIATQVEAISWCFGDAVALSTMAFVGQNYGAKKPDRIKKGLLYGVLLNFIMTGAVCAVFLPFAHKFTYLFTESSEVVKFALIKIYIILPGQIFCGIMNCTGYSLKSLNKPFFSMGCSISASCLLRVIWLNTVVRFYHHFFMIFVIYYIGWITVIIIESIYLSKLIKKLRKEKQETLAPINV